MSDALVIQYVGFKVNRASREYTFNVKGAEEKPREFTLTIANEAFDSRRARFQDGPDICSHRLQRELADPANTAPESGYEITDAELEEYRFAHSPKASHSNYRAKPAKTYLPRVD